MKILVTGAAGFTGGHVTDRLLARGHHVLALDNLSFGRREHVPSEAEFWRVDLGQIGDEAFAGRLIAFDPDYVVHLAAIHHIPYCMAHPDETFASNVRATDVLVRLLGKCPNIRKLVAASTMDVYAPKNTIHRETDVPSPRNVYGLSKLLTEQIINFAVNTSKHLSAVCLRFANVYGPRETNAHLIPDALERVARDTEPEIRMGYLGGARDFIHVFDVADAIVRCLFNDIGRYEVFNLGTGVATPVRRVVEIIRDAFGDDRPVVEDTSKFRKFDRESLTPDITKVLHQTEWRPKIGIEEGLKALVDGTLRAALLLRQPSSARRDNVTPRRVLDDQPVVQLNRMKG